MSGIYWCLEAMDVMEKLDTMDLNEVADYVKRCQLPNGGFACAENHDAHLLHTLSAVQVYLLHFSSCTFTSRLPWKISFKIFSFK